MIMELSGFLGIIHHGNFGACRFRDVFNNLLKPSCHFVIIRGLAALIANKGRHIFNYNNTTTHICCKGRKTIPYRSLTHKTSHLFLFCLKSSVHSKGSGKYAVTSHNSTPFEPHTTCRIFPAFVCIIVQYPKWSWSSIHNREEYSREKLCVLCGLSCR